MEQQHNGLPPKLDPNCQCICHVQPNMMHFVDCCYAPAMTHPQEAVEALARALYVESWTGWIAPAWAELGEDGRGHWIARATALLDQIAPLYREQAARKADKQAALSTSNDYDEGWCRCASVIAAAIRKGE